MSDFHLSSGRSCIDYIYLSLLLSILFIIPVCPYTWSYKDVIQSSGVDRKW